MIKSVTITNYVGESVKIVLTEDDPEHGFLVESIDGLGPVKASINTVDFALTDGGKYNSARAEQRNIVFHFWFTFAQTIEDTRQRTYKYFPLKKKVRMTFETDNRTLYTEGYVESNEPEIFEEMEGCEISVICPDSYFYSLDGKDVVSFTEVIKLFKFPWSCGWTRADLGVVLDSLGNEVLDSNGETIPTRGALINNDPILFGTITNQAIKNIYYDGDNEIGITLSIFFLGSVSGTITIVNSQSNERMMVSADKIATFIGSAITNGDELIITTTKGNKTARLRRGTTYYNVLGAVGYFSDWIQMVKGDNTFGIQVTEGQEHMQCTINYDAIYEGI